MSSSSITEYQVRVNREREEHARRAAVAEASKLESQLDGLLEQAAKTRQKYPGVNMSLPVAIPKRSGSSFSNRNEAEAYRDQLAGAVAHAEAAILATVCQGESQQYLKRVGNSIRVRSAKEALHEATVEKGAKKLGAKREAALRKVSEVMAHLSVPTTILAELHRYADKVLGADDPRKTEIGLADFCAKAATAQKLHRTHLRNLEEVARLRTQLAGLEGDAVALIHQELDRVARAEAPITDHLRARVVTVREESARDADRQYVARIVAEKLRELKYDVGEGFETLFVEGGHTHIQRSDWQVDPEHVVELEVDPMARRFGAKVMRIGDPAGNISYADREAFETKRRENAWCRDLDALLDTLEASEVLIAQPGDDFVKAGAGVNVTILPTTKRTKQVVHKRGSALRAKSL